jgi:acetyl esterase
MGPLRSVEEEIRNPEVRRILGELDPRGGLVTVSLEDKRRTYSATAGARAGMPEPVHRIEDRAIAGPGGELTIRLYHPAPQLSGGGALPIVLYLHGGGMLSGDVDSHDPVCRTIANHVPALTVGVNYRLAPEHPYPAAKDDCFAVLNWLAENATSLGGDPARICVAGDSAGGNLAAVTTLAANSQGGPAIAAQVLIYPMVDATLSCASLVENALIPPFTLVDCVYSYQLYLPEGTDRRDPSVSPLFARDLSNLPPTLILTAEFDILADEGQMYADRLRAAGVSVEQEHFSDMVHAFFLWGGQVAAARLAMNRVVQFVQSQTQKVSAFAC